jgi:hypothetical protein
MNSAINIFNQVWPLVAGGAAITVITQILKRAANLEKNSVIKFLFHTVTFVWTALSYVLGAHGLSALLVVLHGGDFGYFGNSLYPIVKYLDEKAVTLRAAMKIVKNDLPAIEKVVGELETTTGVSLSSTTSTSNATVTTSTTAAQNTNTTPPPAAF